MDSVVFDGVTYVKASVAAKSFRYTSDYIGQLCRAKKVDARLVGRTWFVNLDSIKEHKQNKIKTSAEEKIKVPNTANGIRVSHMVVHPVVNNKTVRVMREVAANHIQARTLKVSYLLDEEALLPNLTKKHVRPAKTIRIELVNAKKAKISDSQKNTISIHAVELPDVALSEDLKIITCSDPKQAGKENVNNLESENTLVNKAISAEQDIKKVGHTENLSVDIHVKKVREKVSVVSAEALKTSTSIPVLSLNQDSGKQKIEVALQSPFTPSVLQAMPTKSVSTLTLMSPLIATLFAVVCAAIIMSASLSVVAFESVYESHIIFNIPNLLDFLQR